MTPVSAETDLTTDDVAVRGARRLPLLGMLLAGALLLSACGGSPEEGAQAGAEASAGTVSATPSASGQSNGGDVEESPDASAGNGEESGEPGGEYSPASSEGPAKNVPMPERPPEMSREAADGAEAAAKYWFALFEYARLSGDTEPLRAMSGDGCTKCTSDLDNIDAVYDVDGWYAEVEYTVDDAEFSVRNGRANGSVRVSSPGFRSYESDGTEHQSDGMNKSAFRFKMTYIDDQWQVSSWNTMGTSS